MTSHKSTQQATHSALQLALWRCDRCVIFVWSYPIFGCYIPFYLLVESIFKNFDRKFHDWWPRWEFHGLGVNDQGSWWPWPCCHPPACWQSLFTMDLARACDEVHIPSHLQSFQVLLLCVEQGISQSPRKLCQITLSLSLLPSSHIKMASKEMKVCAFQNAPTWFWCSVLAESLGARYPSCLLYCHFSFLLLLLPGFPVCLNFIENAHSSTLHILALGLNISLPQVLRVLVGLPSMFLLAMWVRDGAERETGGRRTLGGTRSIIGFQIITGL